MSLMDLFFAVALATILVAGLGIGTANLKSRRWRSAIQILALVLLIGLVVLGVLQIGLASA